METTEFFRGNGLDSALSNLLLSLGDRETAEKVKNNILKHPFVIKRGALFHTYFYLASKLVSDLTENRYAGIMSVHPKNFFKDMKTEALAFYDVAYAERVAKIIEDERTIGRICPHGESGQDDVRIELPALISIVKYEDMVLNHEGRQAFVPRKRPPKYFEWLVVIAEGRYIDNAKIVNYDRKDLHVKAWMEVSRVA